MGQSRDPLNCDCTLCTKHHDQCCSSQLPHKNKGDQYLYPQFADRDVAHYKKVKRMLNHHVKEGYLSQDALVMVRTFLQSPIPPLRQPSSPRISPLNFTTQVDLSYDSQLIPTQTLPGFSSLVVLGVLFVARGSLNNEYLIFQITKPCRISQGNSIRVWALSLKLEKNTNIGRFD